jgi:hypothetical protein
MRSSALVLRGRVCVWVQIGEPVLRISLFVAARPDSICDCIHKGGLWTLKSAGAGLDNRQDPRFTA